MSLERVKSQLVLLLSAAVETALRTDTDLRLLRGTALYDSQKDSFIRSLEAFTAVDTSVRELDFVRKYYGIEQSGRLTLQLAYEYFARASSLLVNADLVNALLADFVAELESPFWITRCITNLRHFHCDEVHVELEDGVSIYGRSPSVLAELGFDKAIWGRLSADWSSTGASAFVLVAETSVPKRPDNLMMIDSQGTWLRCVRTIGAMRLIAEGDVGIGVTFVQRVARFNVGIGGISSTGSTIDTIGSRYTWPSEARLQFGKMYTGIARLEKTGYSKAPGNLDLALRAFMATFDRFPTAMDMKLVDAITALEAVLGTDNEIAFKLSFRVASLLAATDDQRATLLKLIKGFYDTRSRIVHGGRLGKKQSESLAAVDDLRDIVRRLLRSFVLFAADDTRNVAHGFFEKELDGALIDARSRDYIRVLLGLAESTSTNVPLSDPASAKAT